MIDMNNIHQAIFDYATEKYSHRAEELFNKYVDEFPEKDWDLPDESWGSNYLSWLFYEKPLPETGMTIAEEFAEESNEITPEMKKNIQTMRNMIRSEFVVLSVKKQIVKIKDTLDGSIYTVKRDKDSERLSPNMLIIGRIYPFGKYYRTTGVFLIKTSPLILDPGVLMHAFEDNQIKRFEEIQLRKSSTFQSVMKKFPANWIDWMSDYYHVNQNLKKEKIKDIERKLLSYLPSIVEQLSDEAKEVLQYCMENNGLVKYGKLKKYDDTFSFFWNEEPTESPIGELRQKALLFVGKMRFNERNYKVAFIPKEI
ncbi:MAG: hypothetical protein QCI00_07165, partial [Candidatus Thermoplasmatota archaeon]|nr:hypothetical protein [Candidatus Thermoplasmatota archaeon]